MSGHLVDEAVWREAWEAGATCAELAKRFRVSRGFADRTIHDRLGYPRRFVFGPRIKSKGHIRLVGERAADSPPLPAGSPLTWDIINEGTLLQGIPYPPHRSTSLAFGSGVLSGPSNAVAGTPQFGGMLAAGD